MSLFDVLKYRLDIRPTREQLYRLPVKIIESEIHRVAWASYTDLTVYDDWIEDLSDEFLISNEARYSYGTISRASLIKALKELE